MKYITIGFLFTSFIITAAKLNYSAAAAYFLALLFYLFYLDELKKKKQLQERFSNSIRTKEQENEFLNLYINSLNSEVNEILNKKHNEL